MRACLGICLVRNELLVSLSLKRCAGSWNQSSVGGVCISVRPSALTCGIWASSGSTSSIWIESVDDYLL